MEKFPVLKSLLVPLLYLSLTIFFTFALQACDGGTDVVQLPDTPAPVPQTPASETPEPESPLIAAPVAPSLNVSASTKTLHFTWAAVADATYYKLYENADGISGFGQIGSDLTSTQFDLDIAVHFFDWPNARFMLEACNAGGCTASSEIIPSSLMLQSIGKIQKSTEANFGINIAMSADGNTMVINSPTAGGVYVYTKSTSGWTQQTLVKATDPVVDAGDGFGIALSLSTDSNTLAVGSDMEDGGANNSGAAYIFVRTGNEWTQQAYIKASNAEAEDGFGNTIALSADGKTLAVGANGEDSNATGVNGNQANNDKSDSGAVYVYAMVSNNWVQQAYLKSSVSRAVEQFGSESSFGGNIISLSADGNTLAVGTGNNLSGRVYVFTRTDTTWNPLEIIQSGVTDDFFGRSVSLSADGQTVAISANKDNGMGAAYIFVRTGGDWVQQAYLRASNIEAGDAFGRTVALSADGSTVMVSSYEDSSAVGVNGDQNDNSVSCSGAVYVFTRSENVWRQQAYVKAPETLANAFFGRIGLAVSFDGSTLVSGEYTNNAVYLY